jgi:flagellar basal-body rod protein FlgG
MLNKNMELVTPQGDHVLGDTGKLVIDGESIKINQEGMIYVDEVPVGKIKVTAFANPQALVRSADGRYIDRGDAAPKNTAGFSVNSGYLEMSNVNAVREMTDMINIQRTFETYQKIILTLQDMDKISTSRIGKLV